LCPLSGEGCQLCKMKWPCIVLPDQCFVQRCIFIVTVRAVMLRADMLRADMLRAVMLRVVMLKAVMLSVVAPKSAYALADQPLNSINRAYKNNQSQMEQRIFV
jgi:hypothetical protein